MHGYCFNEALRYIGSVIDAVPAAFRGRQDDDTGDDAGDDAIMKDDVPVTLVEPLK